MNRRGFLQSILAAGVAPAFVGASILMPVRRIWTSCGPVPIALDVATEGFSNCRLFSFAVSPHSISAETMSSITAGVWSDPNSIKFVTANKLPGIQFSSIYDAKDLRYAADGSVEWPDTNGGNIVKGNGRIVYG